MGQLQGSEKVTWQEQSEGERWTINMTYRSEVTHTETHRYIYETHVQKWEQTRFFSHTCSLPDLPPLTQSRHWANELPDYWRAGDKPFLNQQHGPQCGGTRDGLGTRRKEERERKGIEAAGLWFSLENPTLHFQLLLTRAVSWQHICIRSKCHRQSWKGITGFLYSFTHPTKHFGELTQVCCMKLVAKAHKQESPMRQGIYEPIFNMSSSL